MRTDTFLTHRNLAGPNDHQFACTEQTHQRRFVQLAGKLASFCFIVRCSAQPDRESAKLLANLANLSRFEIFNE